MKNPRRPLEPHEASYLIARRIAAGIPQPGDHEDYTEAEYLEACWHTPMGQDPLKYLQVKHLMDQRVGAHCG